MFHIISIITLRNKNHNIGIEVKKDLVRVEELENNIDGIYLDYV